MRGAKHQAAFVLFGASALSLVAYYLDAPPQAAIVVSLALLGGGFAVAFRSKHLGLMLSAILCIKFLYVLDLLFAMADERPLRWVAAGAMERFFIRSQSLLLACIWISSFIAVFALFVRDEGQGRSARAAPISLVGTGLGLAFLSQVAFVLIVWRAGGISNMLAAMSSRYELYFGIGFLRVLLALGAVSGALFLLAGKASAAWITSLVVFVELAALGGRSFALLSTFVPITLIWASQKRDFPVKRVVLLGAFAVLFVGLLGAYRSSRQLGQYGSATNPVVRIAMDTGGADNFPSLFALLRRGQISFDGGEIMAAGLFAPIPRALWPGKPVADEAAALGVVLARADDVNSGLPIGPHGLAFYTAGGIAVPLFGMLAGWFAAWIVALGRKSIAWAAVGPFILLITPDMFSPAVVARIIVLCVVAWGISFALRVRLR